VSSVIRTAAGAITVRTRSVRTATVARATQRQRRESIFGAHATHDLVHSTALASRRRIARIQLYALPIDDARGIFLHCRYR
jgi:hypothetical protein